jgi:hypothetical protein
VGPNLGCCGVMLIIAVKCFCSDGINARNYPGSLDSCRAAVAAAAKNHYYGECFCGPASSNIVAAVLESRSAMQSMKTDIRVWTTHIIKVIAREALMKALFIGKFKAGDEKWYQS